MCALSVFKAVRVIYVAVHGDINFVYVFYNSVLLQLLIVVCFVC